MMITASKYCEYIQRAAAAIASQGDYVTQLDLATGDGDHWVNIHAGFQALCEIRNELEIGPMGACFKKIGMTLIKMALYHISEMKMQSGFNWKFSCWR